MNFQILWPVSQWLKFTAQSPSGVQVAGPGYSTCLDGSDVDGGVGADCVTDGFVVCPSGGVGCWAQQVCRWLSLGNVKNHDDDGTNLQ